MDSNNIVPFGRYKGLSKETILKHPGYIEWALEQSSLVSTYPDFMAWLKQQREQTRLVQSVQSPDRPTPQHNAAQNLFTCRDFTRRFLRYLTGHDPDQGLSYWHQQVDQLIIDYPSNLMVNPDRTQVIIDGITVRICDWFTHLRLEGNVQQHDVCVDSPRLIQNGVVKISLGWSIRTEGISTSHLISSALSSIPSTDQISDNDNDQTTTLIDKYFGLIDLDRIICPPIYIEIKPLLGDDYPRVLAKMQKKGQNILYIEMYQSHTTPLDTMKDIFKRSGIRVITRDELITNVTKKIEPITPPPSVRDGTRITVIDKVTKVDLMGIPVHLFNAFKQFADANGLVIQYNTVSASPMVKPNRKVDYISDSDDLYVAIPTTPTRSLPSLPIGPIRPTGRTKSAKPDPVNQSIPRLNLPREDYLDGSIRSDLPQPIISSDKQASDQDKPIAQSTTSSGTTSMVKPIPSEERVTTMVIRNRPNSRKFKPASKPNVCIADILPDPTK